MPRRHAQGIRRHPCVHGAGGAAAHLRRDGAAHLDRAHPHPRREIRRLHGRRLCARVGQARHLHGAGDRRAQSRRRAARRLARAFAGHRHDRRPRRQDQVPQGLSGDRRHAGVRAGDQVQRHHRRRRALPRHGAAGVPRRDVRHARPGASAIPRQRGPGRRRGSRDGAAGGAALRACAAVPSLPRRSQRARRAGLSREGRAAGDRRRRRRARLGRAGGAGGARGGAADPGRDLAQRQGFDPGQSSALRSAWSAPIRARARTASSTRPISSASSAPRPAA